MLRKVTAVIPESLVRLGWSDFFATALLDFEIPVRPLRIVAAHRSELRASDGDAVHTLRIPGRLRHQAASTLDLPVVGDWVAIDEASAAADGPSSILSVLPRRSLLVRKAAGRATVAQPLAANVDAAFVVSSLNHDLNPRRIERTLAIVWESGAQPIVLLNKADLHDDPATAVAEISAVTPGVPVHAISAAQGDGLDVLDPYLQPGRTVVLLGMSGVGKSTLTNRLVGREMLAVNEIRARDDRGVHTTTHRELVQLPGGGNLIDTPGMREFLQWDSSSGLEGAFGDVEELAKGCRFNDCGHAGEPGCAVLEAIEDGHLDAARMDNFRRIQRELAFLARKQNVLSRRDDRARSKMIQRTVRESAKRQAQDRVGRSGH